MSKGMPKQMVPTCICGQLMYFPAGETKFRCPKCRARWEQGPEGYWALGVARIAFTPIFTKRKLNHYERYMAWRNGKAGRR